MKVYHSVYLCIHTWTNEGVCLYLVGVCAVLVFGSVRGVGESLVAAFMLTHVWFLSGVWAQVSFQIFQTRVRLRAALELKHTHTHKAQIKTLLESITRVVPIQIISSVIHFPLCWRKEKLIAARSNHSHVSSLHKRCHWFCADHHIYMNAFDRCFFPKWLAFKVFLCTAFPWKLTLDLGVARVTVWNYAWYENFNMFNAFVCSFYLLLKYFYKYFLKYKNASSLRFVSVVGDICSIYLFYLFKV